MNQEELNLGRISSRPSGEPTTVEDYTFEPIRGQPMLRWAGKRPFASTQYFPAQEKERFGTDVDGWMNQIYWGDNLQVMSHLLKKYRGKVDLVYIDPPFDSKAVYKKEIKLRGQEIKNDHNSFEEKQYTDIWTNDEYLQFMYERMVLIRELLAGDGSIFLHCDWHKVHHLRCILDEVFGPQNFVNEVAWCYYGPGSPGMRQFNRKHDDILWYCKNGKWKFNADAVRIAHDEKTLGNFKDGLKGSGFIAGEYEIPDGKIPEDWWVMAIAGRYPNDGKKRVGYPTEKPLPLLERIINAVTNPGDIVFDCFMGGGTAQTAALKLGRKFIGADINLGAVRTTTKRLIAVAKELQENLPDEKEPKYTGFTVYNVNNYDVFRNPVEAKELLVQALELQPLPGNALYDGEKDGAFYKIMPVNRLATKADLNEIVNNFDYKAAEKKSLESPGKPVLELKLVCMGHEPDLKAALEEQLKEFKLDIEVVDILRDKSQLVFKKDSEAQVVRKGKKLKIEKFYPMNLLKKLSLQKSKAGDWKELVESVMIDFNYDGVLEPSVIDLADENTDGFVKGEYDIPDGAGTIRVKITDLLSESLEVEVK